MPQTTVEELSRCLEKGIHDVFDSEYYHQYLHAMSRFHQYSYGNVILILSQKPEASYVAGFRTWNDSFHRHIRRGEKAIRILSPVIRKNEDDEYVVCGFRPVSVFDISQTEGREIPLSLVRILDYRIRDYASFIRALTMVSPAAVSFADHLSANGCFIPAENRICIKAGLPEAQTVKTLIHEITHALLHRNDLSGTLSEQRRREIEAESVAYIVCARFGIDTSAYSFGYIASWSENQDLSALKESLHTIQETASSFIDLMEYVLFPSERKKTQPEPSLSV